MAKVDPEDVFTIICQLNKRDKPATAFTIAKVISKATKGKILPSYNEMWVPLRKLEVEGRITSEWEKITPKERKKRPPRCFYRVVQDEY